MVVGHGTGDLWLFPTENEQNRLRDVHLPGMEAAGAMTHSHIAKPPSVDHRLWVVEETQNDSLGISPCWSPRDVPS